MTYVISCQILCTFSTSEFVLLPHLSSDLLHLAKIANRSIMSLMALTKFRTS
jgi:hypothetical protein